MSMLEAYRQHAAERAALGIPPLPLSAKQTEDLVALLQAPPAGEEAFLVDMLTYRVPAGVDDAAKVKAAFLEKVAKGSLAVGLVSRAEATRLLGTMLGGFNIRPLIELLDDPAVGGVAAEALKKTLLVFDAFHDVKELADKGVANAKASAALLGGGPDGSRRAPRCRRPHDGDGLQGHRRIQHRRSVAGPDAWSQPRHSGSMRWPC